MDFKSTLLILITYAFLYRHLHNCVHTRICSVHLFLHKCLQSCLHSYPKYLYVSVCIYADELWLPILTYWVKMGLIFRLMTSLVAMASVQNK